MMFAKIAGLAVSGRFFLLGLAGRFFFLGRLAGRRCFLAFLLLLLLEPLLFLVVFLLELLELLLLFLLGLLPSGVVGVFLIDSLLLLDLLLLDLLALLVLFLAKLVELLLMLLVELGVHGGRRIRVPAIRPSVRRTIIIGFFPDVGCGRIRRLLLLRRLNGIVGGRRPI